MLHFHQKPSHGTPLHYWIECDVCHVRQHVTVIRGALKTLTYIKILRWQSSRLMPTDANSWTVYQYFLLMFYSYHHTQFIALTTDITYERGYSSSGSIMHYICDISRSLKAILELKWLNSRILACSAVFWSIYRRYLFYKDLELILMIECPWP